MSSLDFSVSRSWASGLVRTRAARYSAINSVSLALASIYLVSGCSSALGFKWTWKPVLESVVCCPAGGRHFCERCRCAQSHDLSTGGHDTRGTAHVREEGCGVAVRRVENVCAVDCPPRGTEYPTARRRGFAREGCDRGDGRIGVECKRGGGRARSGLFGGVGKRLTSA